MTKEPVKFELATLSADVLVNVTELKAKQLEIVKNNPFVAISDNETYILGKKARTVLRTARTDREKEDGAIGSVFSQVRKGAKLLNEEVILVSRPHEDKQQQEVNRWELLLEEKRNENEILAKERADGFTLKIENYQIELSNIYEGGLFSDLEKSREKAKLIFQEIEDFNWEEFVLLSDTMVESVKLYHEKAEGIIIDAENDRVKNLKIAQENKINSVFATATFKIDSYNMELQPNRNLEKELKEKCFTPNYDFGEFTERYNEICSDLIVKARGRIDFFNSEKIRLAENRVINQKNKVITYRESVLDSIDLMSIENGFESTIEVVKDELESKEFPLAKEEFEKASKRIMTALNSKVLVLAVLKKEAKIKKDEADKKEKEILDKQKKAELKLSKANDQKEKARQTKLKPFKLSGVAMISYQKFDKANEDYQIQTIIDEFIDKVEKLKEEHINKINEL